jgi:hypothetical protein
MKQYLIGMLLISMLLWSFQFPVQPEKYIHIFKENAAQFSITKSDDILQYILHYYPIELQVIRSFRQSKNTTKEIENELLDAKKQYQFLLELKIPRNGMKEFLTYNDGSQTSYENRLTYFAFQFGKDIQYLSKDKLWLPVESFQFERNFGLANQGSFLFEIPKENIGDSLKISIDSKIYSKHVSEFTFSKKTINSLPQLKKVSKWKK